MAPSLSSLLKEEDPDPTAVLQAADAALKQSKSDSNAQRAKVVALLKLDRFGDAVRFVEAGGESLRGDAAFEYAYALYKTGNLEKAREVVNDSDQLPAKHLDAQSARTPNCGIRDRDSDPQTVLSLGGL
jgi:signal recognition particle subunit SRP72